MNLPGIEALHNMSCLLNLKPSREKQLLHLMVRFNKTHKLILKRKRFTRMQDKINFKVSPLKNKSIY